MVTGVFVRCRDVERMHDGPLGPYIDRFAAAMLAEGYKRGSVRIHVRQVAHLSRWLRKRHLEASDLSEVLLEQFRRYRRRLGYKVVLVRGPREFLDQLRHAGVTRPSARAPVTPREHAERRFEQYLTQERRLSRTTVKNYLWVVRRFLIERFGEGVVSPGSLVADDVTRFILQHARDRSSGVAQFMSTGLRSFLRFLRLRGEITLDLAACVPAVPSWRHTGVPVSLRAEDVERLFASCDLRTRVGRRDRAVLVLLARLGLRAGEVAGLTLDDIDWSSAEITIRGKGARCHRFPLPCDVGEALVVYLRSARPRCRTRRVFVRYRAPFRPFIFGSAVIGGIVARALERAGLRPPQRGAHLLRHTAARQMLRGGASLGEIGEVLRHRQPDTTTIYAKVDLTTLRSVAPPWLGGGH